MFKIKIKNFIIFSFEITVNNIFITFMGVKFSFSKDLNYCLLKPFIKILDLFIDHVIFRNIGQISKKNYKIVSLGSYCFSRCITNFSGLKPVKKMGEKSMPFDLSLSYNLDAVIQLIDKQFCHFFDNLNVISGENNKFVNSAIGMNYIHDGHLSKEQFINRYQKRIQNFLDVLNDKNVHVFFLLATFNKVNENQIDNLIKTIKKYRNEDSFDVIFINQGTEKTSLVNKKNLYVIEQTHNYENFQKIHKNNSWVKELKERKRYEAVKIYYEVTKELIKCINHL